MNSLKNIWFYRLLEVIKKGNFKTASGEYFHKNYTHQERKNYCKQKMIELWQVKEKQKEEN